MYEDIIRAINNNFTSVNECDINFEKANVVDGLFAIARAIHTLATVMEGKNK